MCVHRVPHSSPAFIHANSVQHEKYSTARERKRLERYTIWRKRSHPLDPPYALYYDVMVVVDIKNICSSVIV